MDIKKQNVGYIRRDFRIKKVIFNHPATIVLWKDGTKTVVKANGEDFDPEKGLAMAIAKKALGNKGNYFNTIKKWTEPYYEDEASTVGLSDFRNWLDRLASLKVNLEKDENK